VGVEDRQRMNYVGGCDGGGGGGRWLDVDESWERREFGGALLLYRGGLGGMCMLRLGGRIRGRWLEALGLLD